MAVMEEQETRREAKVSRRSRRGGLAAWREQQEIDWNPMILSWGYEDPAVSDIWRPWESKERRPSIQDVIALADLPNSRKVALSNPGHYTKSGHLISMNEPNDQELRLSDNVFSSQRP